MKFAASAVWNAQKSIGNAREEKKVKEVRRKKTVQDDGERVKWRG